MSNEQLLCGDRDYLWPHILPNINLRNDCAHMNNHNSYHRNQFTVMLIYPWKKIELNNVQWIRLAFSRRTICSCRLWPLLFIFIINLLIGIMHVQRHITNVMRVCVLVSVALCPLGHLYLSIANHRHTIQFIHSILIKYAIRFQCKNDEKKLSFIMMILLFNS